MCPTMLAALHLSLFPFVVFLWVFFLLVYDQCHCMFGCNGKVNAPPSAFSSAIALCPPLCPATPTPVIIAFVTATITQICRGKLLFFFFSSPHLSTPQSVFHPHTTTRALQLTHESLIAQHRQCAVTKHLSLTIGLHLRDRQPGRLRSRASLISQPLATFLPA